MDQTRFVTPKVYMVGETALRWGDLTEYLRNSGNNEFLADAEEAINSGISEAEVLCSFFAKLCYRSLSVGKNANISAVRDVQSNLIGCFQHGHSSVFEHCSLNFVVDKCSRVFCFAANTEILTIDGWKEVAVITADDVLLTKNPDTGLDEWSKPRRVHSFKYTGRMVGWGTSQGPSPAVTDNHLLWAAQYDKRRFRGLSCDEIVRSASKTVASELFGKRIVVDNVIRRANTEDPETIELGGVEYDAYNLFNWLGWMATDGGFAKDRANQCTITQSKVENWPELESLMTALFQDRWRSHGPYETDHGETSRLFVINDSAVAAWAKGMIGPNKRQRDMTPLFHYSTRLLRGFVDCAIRGDGNVHDDNGHEVIYCLSNELAGQYQVLVSMIGKCATIRIDDRVGEGHVVNGVEIKHRQPSYVVSISRKAASLISKHHWQSYETDGETVFCPETKNGLVFVRTGGGLPMWSGNTHELVRHRVGTAFSQTSGRYCRIENLQLAWDPILDPVRDVFAACCESIENTVYLAECQLGLRKPNPLRPTASPLACLEIKSVELVSSKHTGAPGDTPEHEALRWVPDMSFPMDKRKKITSAIRRIAPNGQINEIGFSVNLRSLRHLIMVRTGRQAEWEIRFVFEQIYNLVKAKYPLIFYGAREEMHDGIVEVSGLKLQPYEEGYVSPQDRLLNYSTEELQAELQRRSAS